MAHDHFNGTCEQSARNYHGAIARNFSGGRLDARLSCKQGTQYNRIVSGALIPLADGEIPETETPRAIIVRSGYARAKEVRAFAITQTVYAEAVPSFGMIAKPRVPQEVIFAVKTLSRKDAAKRKQAAAGRVLDEYIRANNASLTRRSLYRAYLAGKLSALELLHRSGIITR